MTTATDHERRQADEIGRALQALSNQVLRIASLRIRIDACGDLITRLRADVDRLDKGQGWPAVMRASVACKYLGMNRTKFDALVRAGAIQPNDRLTEDVGMRMFDREELDRYRGFAGERGRAM